MAIGIVSVVPRISVSVGIVPVVSVAVGEEGWVVSDVEGRRAFDVDHFPDGDFEMMMRVTLDGWGMEGCRVRGRERGVPFLEVCDSP